MYRFNGVFSSQKVWGSVLHFQKSGGSGLHPLRKITPMPTEHNISFKFSFKRGPPEMGVYNCRVVAGGAHATCPRQMIATHGVLSHKTLKVLDGVEFRRAALWMTSTGRPRSQLSKHPRSCEILRQLHRCNAHNQGLRYCYAGTAHFPANQA